MIGSALTVALSTLLCAQTPPSFEASATLQSGTGLSMTPFYGRTLMKRSPVFLILDAGFRHPDIDWLELSPAIMLELEDRVGFGLAMRLRAFLPVKPVGVYGLVGLPAFVAPYWLVGVQVGAGVSVPFHEHFAAVAELSSYVYFLGNDLTESKVLGKVDGSAGVRVMF